MQQFLKFLVVSSSNPEKVSMTVKGILLQYVAIIVTGMAIVGVPLTDTIVIHYINQGVTVLGLSLSMFGLCRKIYYAVKEFKNPTDVV